MTVQHLVVEFSSTSQPVLKTRGNHCRSKKSLDLRALKVTNAKMPVMATILYKKPDQQPDPDINQGADGETNGDIAQPHRHL